MNEHSASNILDQYGNRRPVTGGHVASHPNTVMPGQISDQEGFSYEGHKMSGNPSVDLVLQ